MKLIKRARGFFVNKHPLILFDYVIRTIGHVIIAMSILLVFYTRGLSITPYIPLMILSFMAWPHIAMLLSYKSTQPKKSEKLNIIIDSIIISAWISYLGYPLLLLATLYAAVNLNAIPLGGVRFGLIILSTWLTSMLLCFMIFSPKLNLDVDFIVKLYLISGFVIYSSLGGAINYFLINVNKSIKSKLRNSVKEISNINSILQLSFSSLHIEEITKKLTSIIYADFLKFEIFTLQQINQESNQLKCSIVFGPSINHQLEKKIKSAQIILNDSSLFSYILTNTLIIDHDDLNQIPKKYQKNKINRLLKKKYFILMPVIVNNKCIGIAGFYAQTPMKINPKQQERLNNYLSSFILGVNNKKLNAQIQLKNQALKESNQKLKTISTHLAKYIPTQLYDKIVEGKEEAIIKSRKKRVTVCFSDLISFTDLSETVETDLLAKSLNLYLDVMTEVALSHGGTIDKYIGDAIMIFFGDPISQGIAEDACRCIRMAQDMLVKLKQLQGPLKALGLEKNLNVRIGIHSGLAAVGNFGSAFRMDYTVIGKTVNLANRLEASSSKNSIIISNSTHKLVKELIPCKDRGYIKAKGFSHPVKIWEVIF